MDISDGVCFQCGDDECLTVHFSNERTGITITLCLECVTSLRDLINEELVPE